MAGYGEDIVVRHINNHINANGFAYRLPQMKRRLQVCDVMVDSNDPNWFLAIEVKTVRGSMPLNFKSAFTIDKRGEHQLDRLCEFAKKTHRTPIIWLFRRDVRKNKQVVFFANEVRVLWMAGKKSLLASDDQDIGMTVEEFKTMCDYIPQIGDFE